MQQESNSESARLCRRDRRLNSGNALPSDSPIGRQGPKSISKTALHALGAVRLGVCRPPFLLLQEPSLELLRSVCVLLENRLLLQLRKQLVGTRQKLNFLLWLSRSRAAINSWAASAAPSLLTIWRSAVVSPFVSTKKGFWSSHSSSSDPQAAAPKKLRMSRVFRTCHQASEIHQRAAAAGFWKPTSYPDCKSNAVEQRSEEPAPRDETCSRSALSCLTLPCGCPGSAINLNIYVYFNRSQAKGLQTTFFIRLRLFILC